MKKTVLFALILSSLLACKKPPMARTANTRSLGKSDPTSRPYSNVPAGTIIAPAGGTQDKSYRYIVSFFSVASGPDREGMNSFEKFVANYSAEHKSTITVEKISWGREGEMDFCYTLEGLSKEDQAAFITAAKNQLTSVKQVNTFENEPCKHQKRN